MRPRGSTLRKLFGNRAGNAMLEFAIGSGVLVTVFLSAFQYGYIFYQYNALYNNVRNAALFGALYTYVNTCDTPDNAWITGVQNMAVYGNPQGTGNPLLRGLGTSNIQYSVGYVGTCNTTFKPTKVTVWITNYTINSLYGSYTTANKPKVTYPYHGFYDP